MLLDTIILLHITGGHYEYEVQYRCALYVVGISSGLAKDYTAGKRTESGNEMND